MSKIMKQKCDKMVMKREKWTPTFMPQLRFEGLRATHPEKIPNQVQNTPESNKLPWYVEFWGASLFLTWPIKTVCRAWLITSSVVHKTCHKIKGTTHIRKIFFVCFLWGIHIIFYGQTDPDSGFCAMSEGKTSEVSFMRRLPSVRLWLENT